jgi:hypothetical protein
MNIKVTNIFLEDIQLREGVEINEEEIISLAESIKEKGMFHMPIVRPSNLPFDASGKRKEWIVIYGDKRIRALIHNGETWAEVGVTENITEEEARELYLDENLKRKNLDWYDEAALTQELHTLRQLKHGGQNHRGRPKAGTTVWGIDDTARELQRAVGMVSEDLLLVRAVSQDPSLRNIKDRQTAVRLARVAAKRIITEEEANLPSRKIIVEPGQVFLGNAAEVLSKFPDYSFDHCITDPPWIKYVDQKLTKDADTMPVFKELYRVLKTDSFLYMFVGIDDYEIYRRELPKLGFKVSKTPLIWHKTNSMSRIGVASWEYGRNFEFILLAVKGNPALTNPTQMEAVFTSKVVPTKHLIHPNEKPVELIETLIDHCSYEGSFFIEPFGGSFAHVEALKNKGRKWIAIEREKPFYENGLKRLGMENK